MKPSESASAAAPTPLSEDYPLVVGDNLSTADVRPRSPEPEWSPFDWETTGTYPENDSPEDIERWLILQITTLRHWEVLQRNQPGDYGCLEPGELVRNGHRLARMLRRQGFDNLPQEPDGPFSAHDGLLHLERLLQAVQKGIEELKEAVQAESRQPRGGKANPSATHSPDFASVNWFGKNYTFTAAQRPCVKLLWEQWDRKTPEVSDRAILDVLEDSNAERLRDVFRGNPAWGTMIVRGTRKGTRRLAP